MSTEFSTTLLREKFVLRDLHSEAEPVVALSNRVVIRLSDARGLTSESFVIRSQSMHSCIRMAAKIVHTYLRTGPVMARDEKFDYAEAWADVIRDYEQQFNPKNWVSVYNAGKRIFHANEYHAFLDVIENCEYRNTTGNYDSSVFLAEEIFAAKGKSVTIEHDANTGMVLDIKGTRARCGLILRSPIRRTNFSFSAEPKDIDHQVGIVQCLVIAAAFLEGIHLSFLIGRVNERVRLQEIPKYGDDTRTADAARRRLARLNAEIRSFENSFVMSYRPEKPEFPNLVVESEKFTRDLWEKKQSDMELEQLEGE